MEGKILSWNPAAEQLYGVPRASALGANVEMLVPEALRAQFREQQTQLIAGQAFPLWETFRVRAGSEIEVEESLSVISDPGGAPARIASIARDVSEVQRLRRAAEILSGIVAPVGVDQDESSPPRSSKMREVLEHADLLAQDARTTVLILGETGVGKGWLARRIHDKSPRGQRPYFEVNCATLGAQLVESELFGHERGAFTGAVGQKRGIVEVAQGGTLFLDEVGELPLDVQAQLLTFLDTRTFRRIGGTLHSSPTSACWRRRTWT